MWKERIEMEEGETPRSAHEVLGPISHFASDGDSTRCRAQLLVTSTKEFGDFAEQRVLETCNLLDRTVGEG